ncbi:MAG: ATP-binding protein [Verrucomicrobiota bacterium]
MFRSWHGLFLIFSSTLTLLVMVSMTFSGRIARDGTKIIEHTNFVIGTYLELRAVVSEIESATRSSLIVGEMPMEEPLNKAEAEAARILTSLDDLTVGNPAQHQLIESVRALVQAHLASLRELIRQPPGPEGDAARRASVRRGADLMKKLQSVIDEGVRHERELSQLRDQNAAKEFQKQTFTSIGGLILAVATGLASLLLLLRNHRETLRHMEIQRVTEQVREADLQKSKFLANMSHEIRTPMNAILGFTDLLTGIVKEPRAVKYVQSIQSSGRTLLELINEILDISRVEAGKLELRTEPTNVREIVEGVAVMLKKHAQDKGISLETKIIGTIPGLLDIDPLRFRQVVLNLVTNAVKFTNRGGVKVLLNATPAGDESWDIAVTVTDTGVGIPEEDLARIFSPFEQASTHSRSGAQGTGLGLSITQKLVDLMKGEIQVKSTVGSGSEFVVRLSHVHVSKKDADLPSSRSADFNELRPASILVVDDNPTNREVIAGYFNDTHHELLFAQDGMEALELARHAKPDVILMDIRMPRMDGKEARRILRDDERTRGIPVIAQTASSMPEESGKLKEMFDGYLQKPFSPRQLFDEIEPVIGHATMRHATARPAKPVDGEIPKAVIDSLDAHTSASWPDLAPRLNDLAKRDIPRLLDTCPMREIAACGNELQVLAARHDCPPLNRYASALTSAAECFEVDQVERLLGEFDIIAERITGVPVQTSAST